MSGLRERVGRQTDTPPRRTVRVGFVLRIVAVTAIALLLLTPTLSGALFIAVLTDPTCGSQDDLGLTGMQAESVTFPTRAALVGGGESDPAVPTPAYFIPAITPNGGTILYIPTGTAGRGRGIWTVKIYHDAGFNVLTYDALGCLGAAANTLGAREADHVADALAYLESRPDVDAARIGVHGFSAAGASAILAGARLPGIAAVVAVGNYENFTAQVDANLPGNLGLLAPLFRIGAQTAYRARTGLDWSVLDPIGVIDQIAPRPILLVYGSLEPGLAGGEAMAARSGAALVIVPGVGHGGYLDTPETTDRYARALTDFMRAALVGPG